MDLRLRDRQRKPDMYERRLLYREEYVVEKVQEKGDKKPRKVVKYIGPWFAFEYPDDVVALWKKIYFFGYIAMVVLMLIPVCISTRVTDAWYVMLGEIACLLGLYFGIKVAWKLFRSGEKLVHRDADKIDSQIPITSVICVIGFGAGAIGSVVYMCLEKFVGFTDIVATAAMALGCAIAVILLANNGKIDTYEVDDD